MERQFPGQQIGQGSEVVELVRRAEGVAGVAAASRLDLYTPDPPVASEFAGESGIGAVV